MINCVYSPSGDMKIVDDEEREKLVGSGEWFDSPKDAQDSLQPEVKSKKGRNKLEDNNHEKSNLSE